MTRERKTKTHGNTKGLLYFSKLEAIHNGKTLKELLKIGVIKIASYKKHKILYDKIEERHRNSIMSDLPSTYEGKKVEWKFYQLGCWVNQYKVVRQAEEYLKARAVDYREDLISRNHTLLTEYFAFENKNYRAEKTVDSYFENIIDGELPISISNTKKITLLKSY